MQIAIKKSDIHKVKLDLIRSQFGANIINEMEYNSSEFTKTLDEWIFEFDYTKKDAFEKYLKDKSITPRIFN